ncbi:MAG TPA: DNA translocase FtsK 4TM domain-containing protein, partial [Fimbriimonas sp.]|nr:DNA translocase FtsK 4TM domain-containing protein [Fimbriimonas sp.]
MKSSTKPSRAGRASGNAPSSHRGKDIAGIIAIALACVVFFSLASSDSGLFGQLSKVVFSAVVGVGSWVIPILLVILGVVLLSQKRPQVKHLSWGLGLIYLAILGVLAQSIRGSFFDPEAVSRSGGYVGAVIAWTFTKLMGPIAGKVIGMPALALVGGVLTIDVPAKHLFDAFRSRLRREPRTVEPRAQRKPLAERIAEMAQVTAEEEDEAPPVTQALQTKRVKPVPTF